MNKSQKANLRSVLLIALASANKEREEYASRPKDKQNEQGWDYCQERVNAVWRAADDCKINIG